MADRTTDYQPLPSNWTEVGDDNCLLDDAKYQQGSSRRFRWSSNIILLVNVVILFTSIVIAVFGLLSPSVNDERCTRHMSAYSPLIEANAIKYYWTTFDADLRAPSIYRGPPTLQTEAAWRNSWRRGGINVPARVLASLNKTEDIDKLRTDPEFGGGYAAMLEYQHQIHCVNTLRQWTYRDEYRNYPGGLPESLQGSPELLRVHLDHCIEVLRIFVMCTADVTPVLLNVNPKAPQGYSADLNTKHKCRNFDAIGAWVDEHKAVD